MSAVHLIPECAPKIEITSSTFISLGRLLKTPFFLELGSGRTEIPNDGSITIYARVAGLHSYSK